MDFFCGHDVDVVDGDLNVGSDVQSEVCRCPSLAEKTETVCVCGSFVGRCMVRLGACLNIKAFT